MCFQQNKEKDLSKGLLWGLLNFAKVYLLTALLQDDIIVRVGQQCGSSSGSGRYVSAECFRYSGDGDELITPVYTAPTLPPYRVS